MPVLSKRRLTATEFETVRPLLTAISDERIDAARASLVDGRALQKIADERGWKARSSVADAVDFVWKVWGNYQESQRINANSTDSVPPGWVKVTLIAPTALVPGFKKSIADYSAEVKQVKRHGART